MNKPLPFEVREAMCRRINHMNGHKPYKTDEINTLVGDCRTLADEFVKLFGHRANELTEPPTTAATNQAEEFPF